MAHPGIPLPLDRVIQLLGKIPGVGEKTAQRYGIYLAEHPDLSKQLGPEMTELHAQVGACTICNGLTKAGEPCFVCSDRKREPWLLCVVHKIQDMLAIDHCGAMRGSYFVLGKILCPLEDVTTDKVPAANLVRRIHNMTTFLREAGDERPVEVLIATPPSVDGEATSLYLQRFIRDTLKDDPPRLTEFSSGVSYGADLSYAGQLTLAKAFVARRALPA